MTRIPARIIADQNTEMKAGFGRTGFDPFLSGLSDPRFYPRSQIRVIRVPSLDYHTRLMMHFR
jgi:hypothetical protein